MQAVTRVKPEQASKVKSWTPTRLRNGEGSTGREAPTSAPVRSTGVVGTACREGGLGNWGRPGADGRSTPVERPAVRLGVGEGHSTVEAG